jgi:probable metal-binding protein
MKKELAQNTFHVHQVLDLINQEKRALALTELKTLIEQKFGTESTFDSCSMGGMKSADVIEFLLAREKISECEPGKYQLNINNSCDH